ncbi:MAG: HD domain-containing protein [Acidobacteriia bacterium]|nr:HD domain-containing protein [Terriglobia bacterium]
MKTLYVNQIEANQLASGTFLVQSKDIRQKKSGEPFLSLILADRTGEIDAKMWDNVEKVMDTFEREDFVKVKGQPGIFQNRMQFTLHTLIRVGDAEIDFADFFPASLRDPEEMFTELRAVVAGIGNAHLRLLLEALLADEEIARKYKRAPAAKTIHHAWLGGLIEHVLSLCTLCRQVGGHYPHIDVDLLLTGAILHDIGKIDELTYDRGFGYSDAGQLVGHIMMGYRMVSGKIASLPGFPPALRTLVEHMILSHHGQMDFGSPKVPMFAEAMLLHHLDNLDSKMETMRVAVEKDRLVTGCWTGYVPSLERNLLKKDKFLQEPLPEMKPPPARPAASAPSEQRRPSNSPFAGKLLDALKKE